MSWGNEIRALDLVEGAIRREDFDLFDPRIVPAWGLVTIHVAEVQNLINAARRTGYEDGIRAAEATFRACAAMTVSVEEPPEEPYDDSKDHDPCPECAHTKHPGRDVVDPSRVCPRCDGSCWI